MPIVQLYDAKQFARQDPKSMPEPSIKLPRAIAQLKAAAQMHGTNAAAHHNAGDDAQANLCLDVEAECELAVRLLEMLQ